MKIDNKFNVGDRVYIVNNMIDRGDVVCSNCEGEGYIFTCKNGVFSNSKECIICKIYTIKMLKNV